MKNEFIYEEWKNLFGDQGLSDFDRDYEIQKLYQPKDEGPCALHRIGFIVDCVFCADER